MAGRSLTLGRVSIFLHLVWLALFTYVWLAGPFWRPSVLSELFTNLGFTTNNSLSRSILSVSELGSLDLVAIALSVLGVVFAMFGVFGFLTIKTDAVIQAEITARTETQRIAREELRVQLPDLVDAKMLHTILTPSLISDAIKSDEVLQNRLATLIKRIVDTIESEKVSPDQANEIAEASGNDNYGGDQSHED